MHTIKKSTLKSIIWRAIGVVYLFMIAYITTNSLPQSSLITVIHHSVFLIVFVVQDQAWAKIEWGKEYWSDELFYKGRLWVEYGDGWLPTKKRSLLKGFIYEIIIAIPIMILITYIITGSIQNAVTISVIYTSSKVILYQVYEQVYDKCMQS